jgi:hypothetical protein
MRRGLGLTICGSLPYVNADVSKWLLRDSVHDLAVHVYDLRRNDQRAGPASLGNESAYFGIFRRIKGDVIAFLAHRVIFSEERTENCTLGGDISGFCCFHTRDLIHESASKTRPYCQQFCFFKPSEACVQRAWHERFHSRLQTKHIAKQLPLIASISTHLACPVHHRNARRPLIHGQIDLAGEVVQMLDQCWHDFSHPRRGSGSDCIDDAFCEERVVA